MPAVDRDRLLQPAHAAQRLGQREKRVGQDRLGLEGLAEPLHGLRVLAPLQRVPAQGMTGVGQPGAKLQALLPAADRSGTVPAAAQHEPEHAEGLGAAGVCVHQLEGRLQGLLLQRLDLRLRGSIAGRARAGRPWGAEGLRYKVRRIETARAPGKRRQTRRPRQQAQDQRGNAHAPAPSHRARRISREIRALGGRSPHEGGSVGTSDPHRHTEAKSYRSPPAAAALTLPASSTDPAGPFHPFPAIPGP